MSYDQTYIHSDTAAATTLSAGIGTSDTSLGLISGTGYPSPSGAQRAVLVIDPGTSSEEKIYYTARSGNTVTGVARAQFGTTATSHVAGAAVKHILTASEASEYRDAMLQTVGKVTTAGDMLVASGANIFSRLAKGTNGYLLATLAGSVGWQSLAAMGVQPLDSDLTAIAALTTTTYGRALLALADADALAALDRLGTVSGGYVAATTDQGSIGSSDVDLTSLTITFTALANRRYRISGCTNPQVAATGGYARLRITDGSNTQIAEATTAPVSPTGNATSLPIDTIVVPGAGSKTYKLRMSTGDIVAALTNKASATKPSWLLITDIGL